MPRDDGAFCADYGLSPYDAATLTATREMRILRDCVAVAAGNAKTCANW